MKSIFHGRWRWLFLLGLLLILLVTLLTGIKSDTWGVLLLIALLLLVGVMDLFF